MVEVIFDGRLGNNLFQYVLGRMIAEELGYCLDCKPIEGFPATFQRIEGLSYDADPVVLGGHYFNWETVRQAGASKRKIVLKGYFQNVEYYIPYRDRIREWLKTAPVEVPWEPGDEDLVISLRLGNHLNPGNPYKVLPYRLIRKVVLSRAWKRVLIVTEDPSQPFAKRLVRDFHAEIFHGAVLQDFEQTRRAKNLLLSTSSFSWWASFLSDASTIWFPEIFNWSRFIVNQPYSKQVQERLYSPALPQYVRIPGRLLRGLEIFRYFTFYPKWWINVFKHLLWKAGLLKR